MYKVSVIIPNYNRAAVVGETINNMLRQSLPPHEVIVVDDGSTDNSIEVIRSFGDRVTLIEQENSGPGAARNAGLKVASGEFIQFMDSDDLASLNKLEVQAQVLVEQQADIVYGAWAKAWISQNNLQLQNVVLQQQPLPAKRSPLLWFLTCWSMIFQQCLVKKSLLDKVGGYREDMRLYEDGELFVRLLLAGAKLVHEPKSLTLYRLDDYGKLTESGSQNPSKVLDRVRFYLLMADLADTFPEMKQCLKHPQFRLRVWQTLVDLKDTQIPNQIWLNRLEQMAGKKQALTRQFQIQNWLLQKKGGLQNRLQGHRWSDCYQPSSLNLNQKLLIEELGLKLTQS